MANFVSRCGGVSNAILNTEPFSSRASEISIECYENTADLGCYTGCYNIDRLMCCNSNSVISAAASSGSYYDEIIVIDNTTTYAGGGYRENGDAYTTNSYNTYCAVYDGDWTSRMALHEFGHSFGNLCDEYSYTTEGYSYSACVNCRSTCNDYLPYTNVCQLGCDARPSTYYRPEESVMLGLIYSTFNSVSINATYFPDGLEERLEYFLAASDPDLVVSSLIASATAGTGTNISVTDTTTNIGLGAAGASTTRFYLSTNSTLDAGDTLLGGRAVPALGAGASSTGSTSVTIPGGTAPGTYYIIARADDLNVIAEINENNNTRSSEINIGTLPPTLDIEANTVLANLAVTVAITDVGDYAGQTGQFGIWATTPTLACYTLYGVNDWRPCIAGQPNKFPFQINVGGPFTILTYPRAGLPSGAYTFNFKVDVDNNGTWDSSDIDIWTK